MPSPLGYKSASALGSSQPLLIIQNQMSPELRNSSQLKVKLWRS
jgi:hypothetical protein